MSCCSDSDEWLSKAKDHLTLCGVPGGSKGCMDWAAWKVHPVSFRRCSFPLSGGALKHSLPASAGLGCTLCGSSTLPRWSPVCCLLVCFSSVQAPGLSGFGLSLLFHSSNFGHISSCCWLGMPARTTASSFIAFPWHTGYCLVKQVGPERALICSLEMSGNKIQDFPM